MLGEKDISWFLVQYEVGERENLLDGNEMENPPNGRERGVTSSANVDIYLKCTHLPHFRDPVCSQ